MKESEEKPVQNPKTKKRKNRLKVSSNFTKPARGSFWELHRTASGREVRFKRQKSLDLILTIRAAWSTRTQRQTTMSDGVGFFTLPRQPGSFITLPPAISTKNTLEYLSKLLMHHQKRWSQVRLQKFSAVGRESKQFTTNYQRSNANKLTL